MQAAGGVVQFSWEGECSPLVRSTAGASTSSAAAGSFSGAAARPLAAVPVGSGAAITRLQTAPLQGEVRGHDAAPGLGPCAGASAGHSPASPPRRRSPVRSRPAGRAAALPLDGSSIGRASAAAPAALSLALSLPQADLRVRPDQAGPAVPRLALAERRPAPPSPTAAAAAAAAAEVGHGSGSLRGASSQASQQPSGSGAAGGASPHQPPLSTSGPGGAAHRQHRPQPQPTGACDPACHVGSALNLVLHQGMAAGQQLPPGRRPLRLAPPTGPAPLPACGGPSSPETMP